jgi:anti-repressor protein
MSAPRLARTDLLESLEKELDAAGFKYREKCGRKHGRILVDVDGREEPIFVSGTPSDHRAIKNAVGHLRRKIKLWKAETAMETLPAKPVDVVDREIGGVMVQTVDARELHAYLGNGEAFATWIKARIRAYDFQNGLDYIVFLANANKGPKKQEYIITLNMAKDLSMVERNEKGKEARAYFKECERRLMEIEQPSISTLSVPHSDDVSAMLEVLSDMQTALITAVQKNDAAALERVEDIRGAVLHYMKVQLKEPSLAFFDEMRTRNQRSYDRDALVIKEMRTLASSISSLIKKAEQPLLARQFVWADWFDHDKIYQTYFQNQVIPNRRFLSSAISKSLDAYCKKRQRGFDMQSRRIGGRNVNLWHKDSVESWVNIHGRDIVNHHLAKCRRSGDVIEFRKGK